jgi:hypothetical protein
MPEHQLTPRAAWGAGLLTGLAGATFSTLVISLGARRIGRDITQDWMEVGVAQGRRRWAGATRGAGL